MNLEQYKATNKGDLVIIMIPAAYVAKVIGKTVAGRKLIVETIVKKRTWQYKRNYSSCEVLFRDEPIGPVKKEGPPG